ncbi:MBL fold metallo-hydrolase [Chromatiales bacterium (ex Bugula neritina AB1)]|nr:MBL fold metallo-hydrolase [Chromatiales bacterium (ex Bugula neritina AB1)]
MPVKIPYIRTFDFEYGVVDSLSPLVRRVIANNPSSFTFTGTGTYLVGHGEVAVIDPGPADAAHVDALLEATAGETITHILVTHTHMDHSPACRMLQQHCDARTWGFGPHGFGRPQVAEGEFGADDDFIPDFRVTDGQMIKGGSTADGGWTLECIHTPGHASNHLSFHLAVENALFCGDAVMGWSTTIVSPPDGNMKEYLSTLALLSNRDDQIYYPTHGAPITRPGEFVSALQEHRREREQQVLEYLADGYTSVAAMVPVVYQNVDPSLHPAAARSLFATIECLAQQGVIVSDSAITICADYKLSG